MVKGNLQEKLSEIILNSGFDDSDFFDGLDDNYESPNYKKKKFFIAS